jgi:hypothetical protein
VVDLEYAQMGNEIRQMRSYFLSSVDEIDDLKLFEILITENIEQFHQKLQQTDFTLIGSTKKHGSGTAPNQVHSENKFIHFLSY